jgi:BirA family transcriptional regulator, biotin operon repressor / biotin---[acetyl-CoA-carboxylase] ligase
LYKIPANTLFTGQKLIYVPECHSTNSLLSEFNDQAELPEGAVLVTNHQTAGRGQRGNRWETEPGQNLTFSILLKPRFLEAKDQFQLNMALSLGVAAALQAGLSKPIRLKWPNDILVDDKKIGGILIENQVKGVVLSSSIIGIGINVNQSGFPYPRASSLSNFSGHGWDLNETFQNLLTAIEHEYVELRDQRSPALKQRYLTWLYKFNEPHRFKTGEEDFTGAIREVDEDGRLCVEHGGSIRKFAFKEIDWVFGNQ